MLATRASATRPCRPPCASLASSPCWAWRPRRGGRTAPVAGEPMDRLVVSRSPCGPMPACLSACHAPLVCSASCMQTHGKRGRCRPCCTHLPRHLIEHGEGCNHMTCKCGAEFCFLCGTPYTGEAGPRRKACASGPWLRPALAFACMHGRPYDHRPDGACGCRRPCRQSLGDWLHWYCLGVAALVLPRCVAALVLPRYEGCPGAALVYVAYSADRYVLTHVGTMAGASTGQLPHPCVDAIVTVALLPCWHARAAGECDLYERRRTSAAPAAVERAAPSQDIFQHLALRDGPAGPVVPIWLAVPSWVPHNRRLVFKTVLCRFHAQVSRTVAAVGTHLASVPHMRHGSSMHAAAHMVMWCWAPAGRATIAPLPTAGTSCALPCTGATAANT